MWEMSVELRRGSSRHKFAVHLARLMTRCLRNLNTRQGEWVWQFAPERLAYIL